MPNRKITPFIAVLISFIASFASPAPFCLAGNQEGPRTSNPQYWPPALNNYYPDMELLNQDGGRTRLSSFKGKVIVIEPIGMSCPACQAFAGANRSGVRPYGGVRPQANLQSFEELLKRYTGLSLGDPRLVFVQLLLYNPSMQAPSQAEARQWAANFGMRTGAGCYVLVGRQNMVNKYSYDMIPGFQLVDRDFVLRSDSTGHNPRNNLYTHFFPMLKRVL